MQARRLVEAIAPDDVEGLRALLPVGHRAGVMAYRAAVADLTEDDLSAHYTRGLSWFHERFAPHLRAVVERLSGGAWDLSDYRAFAAGSDVDMMAHVVEAATDRRVALYPGDWFGFLVGSPRPSAISWRADGHADLACLCIPSVRNGHVTDEMVTFLEGADATLLNLNLFPTLRAEERRSVAESLAPTLPRAMLSISFSRGFGLTASQLGVLLVRRDHPWLARLETQWNWFTYFYNAIAARAFMALDLDAVARGDDARRAWVDAWLRARELPSLSTGSYYVRSFSLDGDAPQHLAPLVRDGVVRLCFKPPSSL